MSAPIAKLSPTIIYPFMQPLLWKLHGCYLEGLCEGFCAATGTPIEAWEGADTGLDPLPWVHETLMGLKGVTVDCTVYDHFKALGVADGHADAVEMGVAK